MDEYLECGFCKRQTKYIPGVLACWCNAWCWVMDKNTPYKPKEETFLKIIEEMKEVYYDSN